MDLSKNQQKILGILRNAGNTGLTFTEIRKKMEMANTNVVNKALKALMKPDVPIILKSDDGKYRLNPDNANVDNLLIRYDISSLKTYKPLQLIDKDDINMGMAVTVTTEHVKGFDEELNEFFRDSEVQRFVQEFLDSLNIMRTSHIIENAQKSDGEVSDAYINELLQKKLIVSIMTYSCLQRDKKED
jgi:hypothetical protein